MESNVNSISISNDIHRQEVGLSDSLSSSNLGLAALWSDLLSYCLIFEGKWGCLPCFIHRGLRWVPLVLALRGPSPLALRLVVLWHLRIVLR